jgi:hypothetical protein
MEEIMLLSYREQRAIMLETQTPAYARAIKDRRAIDLIYSRAINLRRALAEAGIGERVTTRAIVPMQHQYVSGLNVPSNLTTIVGNKQHSAFCRLQERAKRALVARNE